MALLPALGQCEETEHVGSNPEHPLLFRKIVTQMENHSLHRCAMESIGVTQLFGIPSTAMLRGLRLGVWLPDR